MAKKYGYISLSDKDKQISEAFKGEIIEQEIKFPKVLGVEHPFNFQLTEDIYNSHPFASGAVDKHVDSIVGDFTVTVENKNAQAIIDSFLSTTNFQVFLRRWVRNALVTGNGFAEIDLKNEQIRVLESKSLYVKRDKKGNIKGYTQYDGPFQSLMNGRSEPIEFNKNEIAHLKLRTLADEAYGLGIVWPMRQALDLLAQNEIDQHKVASRKASNPYHFKVGKPGEPAKQSVIDSINDKLQYLNNRTEWVTDGNVEIKSVDFGNIGDKFSEILNHDIQELIYGFQVPAVLMGQANVPEGLAKSQTATWNKRIQSFQEEIEKVIEDSIFRPLLNYNGFDMRAEIGWELPSEEQTNAKIEMYTKLLSSQSMISENMRRIIELELAEVMGIQDADKLLPTPDPTLKKKQEESALADNEEAQEEKEMPQPEVPGAKPAAQEMIHNKGMNGCGCGQQVENHLVREIPVREWANIKEMPGFNFKKFIKKILEAIKKDKFKDLLANNEEELSLGLLPDKDIEKLRIILTDGIKSNKAMAQIEDDINKFVPLRDRYILRNGEKILHAKAENRAETIARTETVRLSNMGLLNLYRDNNIHKVRFLAALSERTCPECEALNGQIFEINEAEGVIPVHSSCRCTFISIVE